MKTSTDWRDILGVAFALVAVAFAGCSGGNTTKSDAGNDATGTEVGMITAADQAFFDELCTAVKPCCARNGMTANVAMCKQSLAKMGQSRDSQVRAACLAELRQLATSATCMPDLVDFADACARLLNEPSGTRAPGETCTSTTECAGSPGTLTICSLGTCITHTVGAEGDYPCLGNKFSVGSTDLVPWKTNSQTPESHGVICPKRAGLYCDRTDDKCKPQQPGGGPCTNHEGCFSRNCLNDGTCLPLPSVNEACTADCAADSYCARPVCELKRAPGAACDPSSTEGQCAGDCAGSALCAGTCRDDGTCSPLNPQENAFLSFWCGTRAFFE